MTQGCPSCGAVNPQEARFCDSCGAELQPAAPAPQPPPPAAPPTEGRAIFCAHCGSSNPPDGRFCQGCGQPLAAPPPMAQPPQPAYAPPPPTSAAPAKKSGEKLGGLLLLLLLLAVAGGGGAYLLLFRGGGEPYDLPQATVATESYDYPALGVSARIPTGWDVDELSKQVIFNGYDAKSDSTVPRFRVEKSDEDLERILEEIRAAGQRGNPSAKAVLQGYLNWWEADNSHIQLKVGKVGTTAIGNQERAGVFVDTHVLGRKRMDGSSIWSRYVFEVIAVGDEWWLVQWTASTDDWAQHWPYLKGISDSLRLAG